MSNTKNENIPKEIVDATAAKPAILGIDLAALSPEEAATGVMSLHREQPKIVAVQTCMLCDNTNEIPEGWYPYNSPWICKECKEAIAYAKELLKHRGTKLFYD